MNRENGENSRSLTRPVVNNRDAKDLTNTKDRTVLYVGEVAMKLRVTEQHVLDLIERGTAFRHSILVEGRGSFGGFPLKRIRRF